MLRIKPFLLVLNQTILFFPVTGIILFLVFLPAGRNLFKNSVVITYLRDWIYKGLENFSIHHLWIGLLIFLFILCLSFIFKIKSQIQVIFKNRIQKGIIVFYAAVTSGIWEELLFRGVLFSLITFFSNYVTGLLISSVIFALIHFEKPYREKLIVFSFGLILGSTYLIFNTLWIAVFAHFINNLWGLSQKEIGIIESF